MQWVQLDESGELLESLEWQRSGLSEDIKRAIVVVPVTTAVPCCTINWDPIPFFPFWTWCYRGFEEHVWPSFFDSSWSFFAFQVFQFFVFTSGFDLDTSMKGPQDTIRSSDLVQRKTRVLLEPHTEGMERLPKPTGTLWGSVACWSRSPGPGISRFRFWWVNFYWNDDQ